PHKATPEEKRKYTKSGDLYANQREHDETTDEYRERVRGHIAASPDRYYARGTVVRLEHDEREHALDVWPLAESLSWAEMRGFYPRNPDACMRYGRTCEYFNVCSGAGDINDDSQFRTSEKAHEELEEIHT